LWLVGRENKVSPHVDEDEAETIQVLSKIGFSTDELARVFQRSTSTIHHHIQDLDNTPERERTLPSA
jgi:IS30 family transposase